MQYINIEGIRTILEKIKSKMDEIRSNCSSEISSSLKNYPKKEDFYIKSINGTYLFGESEYVPRPNEIYLEFSSEPSGPPPSAMITIQNELQANSYYKYVENGFILTFDDEVKRIETVMTFGSNLTKIVLPDSTTSISDEAFNGCSSLNFINIPDNITNLSSNLFAGCTNLCEIHLGKNITKVLPNTFIDSIKDVIRVYISSDDICFDNCFSKDVPYSPALYFLNDNPKFLNDIWINDDDHCAEFSIQIPKNLIHIYKSLESFSKYSDIKKWNPRYDLKIESDTQSNWNEIEKKIDKLRDDLDLLVNGDSSEAIESFNEIIAFLEGIEDSSDLDGIIGAIEQQIADLKKLVENIPYDKDTDTLTVANLKGNADTVTVNIGDANTYHSIVVTSDGKSLFRGTPALNYKTGDIKATSFTTNGGKFIGDLEGHANSASDLTGHNEATNEQFTYRQSAGTKSIKDDSATIKNIYGNSVVWNNPIKNKVDTTAQGIDGWYNRGGNNVSVTFDEEFITQVTTTSANQVQLSQNVGFKQYHKYFILWEWDYPEEVFTLETDNDIRLRAQSDRNGGNSVYISYTYEAKGKYETIWEQTSSELPFISVLLRRYSNFLSAQSWTITNRIKVCDLTQMFGAGNEPETVEEYYQRKPILLDEYEYNEGTLVNFVPHAIKTTGFNQWDEQWQNGWWDHNDGSFHVNAEYISNLNPIKILPDTEYYVTYNNASQFEISYYDDKMQFIGRKIYGKQIFTTLNNAVYINFTIHNSTYNTDICINLSHTGYRDGEYEPYKEHIYDLSWVNKYFPNGMRSAGSVRDEIRFNSTTQKWEAVQKVGVVDLGSLKWLNGWASSNSKFYTQDIISNGSTTNFITEKYERTTSDAVNMPDMTFIAPANNVIVIYDSAYTNAAAFKAAMQGVMLNYELAEPIITVIDDVVDGNYNVYDFGTEELISSSSSTAFNADIIYQFNAVDRIRNNENNINLLQKNSLKPEYVLNRICSSETVPYDSEIPIYEVGSDMEKDKCGIKGSGKYFTLQITSESTNNNIPTAKAVHDYIENKYSALIVEIEDNTEYKDLF